MAKQTKDLKQKPTVTKKTAPSTSLFTEWVNPSDGEQKIWMYFFIAIAVFIFFLRPVLSYQFGPSSDEVYHKAIGEMSYDYLASFGKNDSIFHYTANQREDATLLLNYGPLLEVTAAALYKNFNMDPLPTRHLVITIFTFILFLFAGLTGYKLGGWRAGTIAMLFMILAPRLFGEAFNNPKDPPFAAGYMMGVFGLIYFISELPRPSWKSTLVLMTGIGLAFAVRVGGLLFYAYLGLFLLIAILFNDEWRKEFLSFNFKYYQTLIIRLVVVFVGSWIIGIITWPAALKAPLSHPFYALEVQSSYPTVIRVLFGGEYIPSNEVPWTYNPIYIAITTPLITLAGLILAIAFFPLLRKIVRPQYLFILFFVSCFPLFYIIYKKSALLNGWRHSYFTFTGLCVIAALGFEVLFRWIKKETVRYVLYAVLALGLLLPTVFMVKNFPMVYTYMNELVGGVDGSYAQYQLDYYACSAKPAADWMQKNIPYQENLKVVSNNPWELNESWKSNGSKFTSTYIRYRERNEQDWDYAVFLPQFVDPAIMKNGFFASKGTVHTVKVDNSIVAIVVKREDKNDFEGITALKRNDVATAIEKLTKAIQYNPNNEIAWTYLGWAYATAGRKDEAVQALSNALKISPENQMAMNIYQQIISR